jgi:hypothetical protein
MAILLMKTEKFIHEGREGTRRKSAACRSEMFDRRFVCFVFLRALGG